jgi:putative addiction module component (TIGR02574 family)
MMQPANELLAEALRLPPNERSELAARLIESLDPTIDNGIEAAWSAEIQKRIEELQTGQVKPIPWSEARLQILEDAEESGASVSSAAAEITTLAARWQRFSISRWKLCINPAVG